VPAFSNVDHHKDNEKLFRMKKKFAQIGGSELILAEFKLSSSAEFKIKITTMVVFFEISEHSPEYLTV